MRINRIAAVPATAALAVGALAGCGGSSTSSASSAAGAAKSSASSVTSGASGASSSDDISCPTKNTRKFAKTRFTTDVGLAAGTFHHWIYKPYKAGSFKKGDVDKSDAVKAAGVALVDIKLLKNAQENAKANPTLCKAVAKPLSDAISKLKNVKTTQLLAGNAGGLAAAQSAFGSVLSGSKSTGNQVQEKDSLSEAKKAAGEK